VLNLGDGVVGGVDHSRHLIEIERIDRGEGLRSDVEGWGDGFSTKNRALKNQ